MQPQGIAEGVCRLAANFERIMSSGRYMPYPAVADEHGLVHVPPRVPMAPCASAVLGAGAFALGAAAVLASRRSRR